MITTARGRDLFVVALLPRVAVVALRGPSYGRTENLRVGFTLSRLGFLGNTFSVPTGPSAHVSPVYPSLVALIDTWTRDEPRTMFVLRLVTAVVAALNVALLPILSRTLRLPREAGVIAAIFWIVPVFAWIELSGEHETVLTTLALLGGLIIALRVLSRERLSFVEGFALGVVIGLVVHFSPLLLLAVGSASAVVLASRYHEVGVPRGLLIGAATGFLFIILPYSVRNARVLGQPMLVRDNLGLELSVSNASNAHPTADANLQPGATMERHPFISVQEAHEVSRLGEVAYNRKRMLAARAWMTQHRQAFLLLVAKRSFLLIVPYSKRPAQTIVAWMIATLAAAGGVALWRTGHTTACLTLIAALAGYELIYVLIQYDIRYVYPGLWLQTLGAGYFLHRRLAPTHRSQVA